ncbi:DUF6243 family protein [Streptomyces spiramenti]|uniref:DUF3073 domain-containing protein n=1 Tax=Streptomyces spiramenti TaxID=2720606 RepID=A0ABX1AG24_9ACTN|nr:DUF6243 family protein [Streptomyces spiramenti]NJP66074.1 hypothetical protein [Streptomyces spiramenti]
MSKQRAGSMLGVGGTRSHLSKGALRGGRGAERAGAPTDPQERKRELLRRLREKK